MTTVNQLYIQGQPDRRWNPSFQISPLGLPSWVTLANQHDLAVSLGQKWY